MKNISEAIEVMSRNTQNISSITKLSGHEFAFKYLSDQIWELNQTADFNGNVFFILTYHPRISETSLLRQSSDKISFTSDEFPEAYNSMANIYSDIKNRFYDLDKTISEIINNDNNKSPF